jgi:hypothetical protein
VPKLARLSSSSLKRRADREQKIAIRQIVFDDHCLVRKIMKDFMDFAMTNGVDYFVERSFEVDSGVQMSRVVTPSVFSKGADKTAFDRHEAFSVGIIERRIECLAKRV